LVDIHAMRALGSSVASLDIFQFGSTGVRPSAKLIKTKTGNVTRSISSVSLWSNGVTAFHCAIRNAWVRGIALGIPVVPEVSEISATVWGLRLKVAVVFDFGVEASAVLYATGGGAVT